MRQNCVYKPHLFGWLLGLWLLQACAAPKDSRPDKLIPAERMADILVEVHIAEARVSRMGMTATDSSNAVYRRLERDIFRRLTVDTAAYTASYSFYAAHPEDMERIYNRVTEILKKKTEAKKPTRS